MKTELLSAAILLSSLALLWSPGLQAAAPSPGTPWELSLEDALRSALARSPRLGAVRAERAAATARAEAQQAALWPKLTLEASYRYIDEVPAVAMPFGVLNFGARNNYSIGPALQWTAWDFGALRGAWHSARSAESSKASEEDAARRQLELSIRLAYFRVQLGLEQLRLVADSLNLAEAQYHDIQTRLRAGVSSRIDSISAHREVLNFSLQLKQSQSELSAALRELLALTGEKSPELTADFSAPADARLRDKGPSRLTVSAWIALDPLTSSSATLESIVQRLDPPDHRHPQAAQLEHAATASQEAAASAGAGLLPRLAVSAKSSLDYPNGPLLEQVHQNTVGATLTFPLFEGSRSRSEAAERTHQAEAAAHRRDQALLDLAKEWSRTRDQLASYTAQKEIIRRSTEEAAELARLVYGSYRAGRASFLEVQSANLRALETKVQAARNETQILMQLAALASLGIPKTERGNTE